MSILGLFAMMGVYVNNTIDKRVDIKISEMQKKDEFEKQLLNDRLVTIETHGSRNSSMLERHSTSILQLNDIKADVRVLGYELNGLYTNLGKEPPHTVKKMME